MGPLNLLIERPTFSIFGPETNSAVLLNYPFCQILFYFEIFTISPYFVSYVFLQHLGLDLHSKGM